MTKKIKNIRQNCSVTPFNSGITLIEEASDYNIIFLDIEMPELDGIQTAVQLRKSGYDGIIIFLTSHTEFMPTAFKVKAFRFLSKPVSEEDFEEALTAAEKELFDTKHISVCEKGKTTYLKVTDIVCIEAYGDGTYIYDKNNNVYDTDVPLKTWSNRVGNELFFQISKSMLVSFLYVKNYTKNRELVLDCYKTVLTISRRNYSEFCKSFLDFVKLYSRIL